MDLESFVRRKLGKSFLSIPRDGLMREFKGESGEALFVVGFDDCGCCGNFDTGEAWTINRHGSHRFQMEPIPRLRKRVTQEAINFEKMVVACGDGLAEQDIALSPEDRARYLAALKRLEAAL